MGTGEAVVSLLEAKGVPAMVSRTLIRPPESRMGAITAAERAETVAASPLAGKYETAVDRESAQEILGHRAEKAAEEAAMAEAMLKQASARDAELKQARRYRAGAVARAGAALARGGDRAHRGQAARHPPGAAAGARDSRRTVQGTVKRRRRIVSRRQKVLMIVADSPNCEGGRRARGVRKDKRRLRRQFEAMSRAVPATRPVTERLLRDGMRIVRLPVALLLVLGGVFSILPFFGIWMLPLGLMLLAVDVPLIRPTVSAGFIRARRRFSVFWRQRIRGRKPLPPSE